MPSRGRPRSFDRDAALRRAMEVFWAKGYDNASMAELSAAMGVAPPSIYAAFGDKESLFREAVELYESEGAEIWGALVTGATARQAIEAFLTATARNFTRPNQPRGCMIVLGCLHADQPDAGPTEELRARRRANLEELRRRLEAGRAAGELPDDCDVAGLARFYLTVQEGMSIQARDGATCDELMQVAAAAMAAWPDR